MSILKDEVVIVKFIPDYRNGITDKMHPLYGGFSSNASISIVAPLLTRKIEKIFTKEELEELSAALNGADLSSTSEFWKEYAKDEYGMPKGNFPIFLKKEGAMFNKKNALDYIKIRILEKSNIVAESEKEIKNRSSEYRFVLIKHDDMHKEDLESISFSKAATKLHTKYEKDIKVLRHALKAFNKTTGFNSKIDFLQKETWKLVLAYPEQFVKALSDPLMESKIILDEALRYKLVSKSDKLFYTLSGESLKLDSDINDYEGAARFLDSGAGQEIRLALEVKINELEK